MPVLCLTANKPHRKVKIRKETGVERKIRNAEQLVNVLGLAIGEMVLANKALRREGDAGAAGMRLARAGNLINAYLVPVPGTVEALASREGVDAESLYSSNIEVIGAVAAVLADWVGNGNPSASKDAAAHAPNRWADAVETLTSEIGRLEVEAKIVAGKSRR